VPVNETTAAWYTRFAQNEAHGRSAIYASWALGVATDPQLIAAIDRLPAQRRQPALLFAVTRLLGAPVGDYGPWRDFTLTHWPEVEREVLVRLTQTNEPLRCAALMPVLATIDGPIALLEVGASAGLCLYPDRYSYTYDGGEPLHPADGPSALMLECATPTTPAGSRRSSGPSSTNASPAYGPRCRSRARIHRFSSPET
jgi:hypothetical protein